MAAITAIAIMSIPSGAAKAATTPYCNSPGNPTSPSWCIWTAFNGGLGYSGYTEASAWYSVPNLSTFEVRNLDKSLENAVGSDGGKLYLRLYYSPNYGGAWVCVNPGFFAGDTGAYYFDNGSGKAGFDQTIYDNVASLTYTTSACTNPLG
jgi:hypothetical protein